MRLFMSSKTEPPITKSSSCYDGWTTDHYGRCIQKTFQFDSKQLMNEFSLSLLTSEHDRATNLSVVEFHTEQKVRVEIFCKDFKSEIKKLIRTIEICYKETHKDEKQHHFWS